MDGTDDLGTRTYSQPLGAAAASVRVERQRIFFHTCAPTLLRLLMWRGAQRAEAEEIVVDIMTDVVLRWDDIENHEAWARVAARHALARRRSRTVEEPRADLEFASGTTHDLDDWMCNDELQRLLALLPTRQREVMVLYIRGYQPREIAERLQIRSDAVRSSLLKARRTIAVHLDGRSDES